MQKLSICKNPFNIVKTCIFIILLSLGLIELFTINVKGSKQLEILEINQNRNMRCLKVTMVNNNLLEGEDLLSSKEGEFIKL